MTGVIESVETVQTIANLWTSTGPAGVIMMARAECNFMIMFLQSVTAPYCPIVPHMVITIQWKDARAPELQMSHAALLNIVN